MKNCCLFLTAIALLLSCSSCSQSDPIEENVRKEVRVIASFENLSGDSKVTTRAVDDAWESGDAIGLFMKKTGVSFIQPALSENAKYITTGSSSFVPFKEADKLYYPFDKSNVDFISYYPYTASLNGLNYEVDVADQSDLSAIDLLYSNNVTGINYSSENINLNFAHQLSKVVLKITTNYTDKYLNNLSAKITNVNTKASFTLVDGTITASTHPTDVVFNLNSEKTFAQAIVLPDTNFTDKKIVITLDGTNYSYPLSSSAIISSFEKSKQYEYTITIEPTHGPILEDVTAKITDWITVKENITVVEDPSETPPEGDDSDSGNENTPTNPEVGDGTQENPYTVAQAKQLTVGQVIWVKGYIVGTYRDGYFKKFTNDIVSTNGTYLALADLLTETNYEMTFPVKILDGSIYMNIQKQIDLNNNPANLRKEVALMGSVVNTILDDKIGLKEIQEAYLDGVKVEKNNTYY